MSDARKVPGIGRQHQQFSRATIPPMPPPMMVGNHQPQQTQQPPPSHQEEIAAQMHDLAMEIYCGLVIDMLGSGQADREAMQTLAKHAIEAARIFANVLEDEANA